MKSTIIDKLIKYMRKKLHEAILKDGCAETFSRYW